MTWIAVAKKDFRDAVQSRALWALVCVFVLLSVLSTYAYIEVPQLFGEPGGATFGGLVFFTVGLTSLFVPLAAIVVCYKSLAGERELGSIKLLLSLPTTRRHVYAGKTIGRAGVLTFGLAVGLIVGLGFGAVLLGTVAVVPIALFLGATLGFAAAYASIMVGLSATTGSTTRATTLALGFFVVFELFWDVIPVAILYVVNGFALPTSMPDWIFPVMQLSPSAAYFSTVVALLPNLAASVNAGGQAGAGMSPAEVDPFYTTPEIGIVVLVLWTLVAFLIGYTRFEGTDF